MKLAALIRDMAAAGAPPEAIALAVEALEAVNERDAERRAKQAERKRRSRDGHGTVTGQRRDDVVTVTTANKVLPDPPKQITTTPVSQEGKHAPRGVCASRLKPEYPGEFEMCWTEYPRKKGTSKNEAHKAWDKHRKAGRAEQVFEGILIFAEQVKTERIEERYIPHMATWLNEWRFDTILEAAE